MRWGDKALDRHVSSLIAVIHPERYKSSIQKVGSGIEVFTLIDFSSIGN